MLNDLFIFIIVHFDDNLKENGNMNTASDINAILCRIYKNLSTTLNMVSYISVWDPWSRWKNYQFLYKLGSKKASQNYHKKFYGS